MSNAYHRLGLLAVLFLFSSVSNAITLTWVGCGITKKAFMQELVVAYKKSTGTEILLEGGGATKGIRSTTEHTADMGGSCRYRVKGEAPDSRITFNPVAWDALVVIVNKDNPIESISMEQLRSLYRGEINNWQQLNEQDRPLALAVRNGKISGVGLTIRQLVFNDPDMDFPQNNVYKSSGPLEEAVENDLNAIGMTGISSARKRNVKILKLDNKEPSFDNIKSGNYLLYRPLYLVIDKQSENIKELEKFLGFAHSKAGRDIIRKNGVVPYLEALALSIKQQSQWKKARNQAN
ncbi:substrate-binding domain-containing protein [Sedimenticola hydrogenitrophicus]|uniref:substrate-binding domain-containing protein n=1 Tax=Sedimenticola hydrogenitrophicus TaxID=2967975 RepID=UPI0023AF789E|nr:substrate-binding domain-containing protein [Sedimenticola hydrogenitrophicus]